MLPTSEPPGASSEPASKVPPTDEQSDDQGLAAMTAERDQLKDQLLRALADTENMRRRSEREAPMRVNMAIHHLLVILLGHLTILAGLWTQHRMIWICSMSRSNLW